MLRGVSMVILSTFALTIKITHPILRGLCGKKGEFKCLWGHFCCADYVWASQKLGSETLL